MRKSVSFIGCVFGALLVGCTQPEVRSHNGTEVESDHIEEKDK